MTKETSATFHLHVYSQDRNNTSVPVYPHRRKFRIPIASWYSCRGSCYKAVCYVGFQALSMDINGWEGGLEGINLAFLIMWMY